MADDVVSTRDARLDELIPAPWTTLRRIAVLVAVAGVVAMVVLVVRSGLAGPQLAHADDWGSSSEQRDDGTIDAERLLRLRNDGWVDLEVESLELPELDDVRWGTIDELPRTLQPGEVAEVWVPFTVSGCDIDLGGFDVFPVRARSGVAPSRVVEVDPPVSMDPNDFTVHVDDDDLHLPGWSRQEPSWILEAIEPTCTTPPGQRGG